MTSITQNWYCGHCQIRDDVASVDDAVLQWSFGVSLKHFYTYGGFLPFNMQRSICLGRIYQVHMRCPSVRSLNVCSTSVSGILSRYFVWCRFLRFSRWDEWHCLEYRLCKVQVSHAHNGRA